MTDAEIREAVKTAKVTIENGLVNPRIAVTRISDELVFHWSASDMVRVTRNNPIAEDAIRAEAQAIREALKVFPVEGWEWREEKGDRCLAGWFIHTKTGRGVSVWRQGTDSDDGTTAKVDCLYRHGLCETYPKYEAPDFELAEESEEKWPRPWRSYLIPSGTVDAANGEPVCRCGSNDDATRLIEFVNNSDQLIDREKIREIVAKLKDGWVYNKTIRIADEILEAIGDD